MELYLIRHADAVPLGEGGMMDDESRPLTKKGEQQAASLASGLQHRGIHLGAVVTSPLRRARQTAEGLLKAWNGPSSELRVCEDLGPGGKRRKVSRFLKELGTDQVALVGHQPDLGELAAWLIGSKKAQIDVAKAGVAYIACDNGPGKGEGRLVWLVPPEWFT